MHPDGGLYERDAGVWMLGLGGGVVVGTEVVFKGLCIGEEDISLDICVVFLRRDS